MVNIPPQSSGIDYVAIYGALTGTVGAVVATLALYKAYSKDAVRLRINTSVGESVKAGGECFGITIFNDGRPVKVVDIESVIYGRVTDEASRVLSEFDLESRKLAVRFGEIEFPFEIATHDKLEYRNRPFPWAGLMRVGQTWGLRVVLSNGNRFEIPSWRISYPQDIYIRSRFLKPQKGLKMDLGKETFAMESQQRALRLQSSEG